MELDSINLLLAIADFESVTFTGLMCMAYWHL
jgi:hypothetical protein